MRKTYRQFCGLAKALDHIGERWTLLIIRELLVAPRSYSELRDALDGIATNLLAERLRALSADGLVDVRDGRYRLTSRGRDLEPAILELVRWGGGWMSDREADETFRPEWLAVALRALLPRRRSERVELHVDGVVVHLDRSAIGIGPIEEPDAVVMGRAELILAIAAGRRGLSGMKVRGDRAAASKALGVKKA